MLASPAGEGALAVYMEEGAGEVWLGGRFTKYGEPIGLQLVSPFRVSLFNGKTHADTLPVHWSQLTIEMLGEGPV